METRANHILIGAFVLVIVAATFAFVIWLAKVDIDRERAQYYIFFEESVSGLGVGGDVRFNGILIGSIADISIDPDNPARVRVLIDVDADAPIRVDTKASLEFQGITGVSFVQLIGGSPSEPLLEPKDEDDIPVIASVPSTLHELFAGAPEVIDRVLVLINRLALLVDDENQTRFKNILANVDEITTNLNAQGPQIERILNNMNQLSVDLSQAAQQVNALVGKVDTVLESTDATLALARGTLTATDQLLEQDVRALVGDLRSTAQSINVVSRRLDEFLEKNSEPLDVFASHGLVEFTKFIEEARILIASTERLLENLEADPAQFLFGRQRGGVEAE